MLPVVTAQTFSAEVLQAKDPVLVYFWAAWCGPCRLLTPCLEQWHQTASQNLRVVSINADENFTLANRYRLATLPTLIWFADGRIRDRLEGISDREALQTFLKRYQPVANAV
ncbi:thioredoxin [Clostridium botulinum]|uniref:Thioredoxin n=2 Tax=Synechococcus elongatus TaxID=32046 RepID=Q9ALA7_SYNE7|nr:MULTISPECIES: thioredoxin family protein [Terrabacteria group]AAG59993.1 Trx [Synechococcus elongatus PCC 7942 = FACHB-805]ABB58008.1 thioredoxin [Synechococcus elongatus PCC 7942 = FACHB-805]AJD57514.1 thioredoxin [Synechococcus elongatus UTEX 2973]MBD2586725.1 thioredoxin family protein [Synechococcus elongatus FACHB-242]MBD2687797.1 thioredoxin family protein [Synechococcus elongatus FACHB-1061]